MVVFSAEDRAISIKDAVMNGHKTLICRLSTPSCDALGIAIPVVKLSLLHGRTFLCFLNGKFWKWTDASGLRAADLFSPFSQIVNTMSPVSQGWAK